MDAVTKSVAFLFLLAASFPLGHATDSSLEANECKKTWTYFKGSCYKHFSKLHADIKGEKLFETCQAKLPEAIPVSISTKEENDFIYTKLLHDTRNTGFLIGFSRRNRESWGWLDGPTGKYTNWIKGADLKNEKKKCAVILRQTGKWETRSCIYFKANFICKYIPRACRKDWIKYGGACYIVSTKRDSGTRWAISLPSLCQKLFNGALPLSIHSPEENDFVLKKLKRYPNIWTGFYGSRKIYRWNDGSPVSYTNWAKGHPANHYTGAVYMKSSGKWIATHNRGPVELHYICKYFQKDDGLWSPWSSWAACSATCGWGKTKRWRKCNNPSPSKGGISCDDYSKTGNMQVKKCRGMKCPGYVVCLPGWTLFEGTCYKRVDSAIKGSALPKSCEALKNAASHKSVGAAITKASENTFLLDKILSIGTGKSPYWIGLTSQKGKWVWASGSSLTYTNWVKGHPKSGAECAWTSNKHKKWESVSCSEKTAPYICQYQPTECTGRDLDANYATCCTPSNPCPEEQGDCDYDADCQPGLFCVLAICPIKKGVYQFVGGRFGDSCCVKNCSGTLPRDYAGCCSSSSAYKCGQGEGDCDSDSDCLPGFKCRHNSCPKKTGFLYGDDCCYKEGGCNGMMNRSHLHCCDTHKEWKCGVNEGHCRGDDYCKKGLKCGRANCPSGRPGFQSDSNCCAAEDDECALNIDSCDHNADCINTKDSYKCKCKDGFVGDGKTCFDVDECTNGLQDCHKYATCDNTVGSFKCACKAGFTGDGKSCKGLSTTQATSPTSSSKVFEKVVEKTKSTTEIAVPEDTSPAEESDFEETKKYIIAGGVVGLVALNVVIASILCLRKKVKKAEKKRDKAKSDTQNDPKDNEKAEAYKHHGEYYPYMEYDDAYMSEFDDYDNYQHQTPYYGGKGHEYGYNAEAAQYPSTSQASQPSQASEASQASQASQ